MSIASLNEGTAAVRQQRRFWRVVSSSILIVLLPGLLIFIALLSLTIGRYPLTLGEIGQFFGATAHLTSIPSAKYDLLHNVIIEIRMPRIIAAGFIGAALSVSGAAFQATFRNPLVSPGLMGVLGGAGFGAALGILWSGQPIVIESLAFAGGLIAVMLGIGIAHVFGTASLITLVLGGLISGAFFTSALSLLKYLADPYEQLPAIVYWLMGSLGNADLAQAMWLTLPILTGIVVLIWLGRALDALAMGEDEARSLGVPVETVRYGVIAMATLISALSVSTVGMIGWVGLVVPHFSRLVVGPCNTRLLPASALFGAIFLIGADIISRSLIRTEIPIGIITELLGIPAFILVLHRVRKGWA